MLELSLSISPSNEYSGLISFRIDWFDLIAIQGTLKSLFQHHSLKVFFVTQPSLGPTFTTIHNYQQNNRFHYMDLCRQS